MKIGKKKGSTHPYEDIPIFVKNLIGQNKVLEAVEILKVSFLGNRKTSSFDMVILIESRWRDVVKKELTGIFTLDEIDRIKLVIKSGLLEVVNLELSD